jgi:hypothetical protein
MSGEGTQPVAAVLLGMTEYRLGRVLLWLIAAFLALLALVPGPDSETLWLLASLPGMLALVSTGTAWWKERRESSFMPGLLPRLVLGTLLFGAAALLMWWRRRRELAASAPVAPPSAEDVDRWAHAELSLSSTERGS